MNRPLCQMCEATGPALLPVRYSVVPDRVVETLPAWAETPAPSAQGYHYALRALRQGFLYVYYANAGLFEQESWEAWSISEDGGLWKQFGGPFGIQAKKTADCHTPTHQSTNMEFIVLRDIALRQETWLAFSPSVWSMEAIQYYHTHPEARQKRMQCVKPWQWRSVPEGVGIAQVTEDNLNGVMDYHPEDRDAVKYLLPCNPKAARISRTREEAPYYQFVPNAVGPQGTLYPWSEKRMGNAAATVRAMQKRGAAADGSPVSPVLIALHDPIGVAHELAGWSDDIAGEHKTWLDELSIEFMTENSLIGVENQLRQLKTANEKERIDDDISAVVKMAYGAVSKQELANLRESITRNTIKSDNDVFARDWGKYTAELNLAKRQAFNQCYADFCGEVAKKLEQLAQFRVSWLKQSRFITCCQDFYSTRLEDNLNYREAVDYAIVLLNVTEAGSAFLDDQIDRYSALSSESIVWRSLLLNNPDVMKEMAGFLQQMKLHKDNHQPADTSMFIKTVSELSGKLVEAYDKANEALERPPTSHSTFARAMLHCDRRLVTLGDRFLNFTRLGKRLDSLNEMLSRTLFSVISGVPFDQAVDLSVSQLKEGNAFRQQVLEQLKRPGAEARLETRNNYNRDFKEFAESAEGESVLKKSRIKLLVLLFNGLEFAGQLKESKGDVKSHAQVTAAFLGTLSTAMEIVGPMVEHGIKNMAATDTIKFIGTSAGTLSSTLNLGVDMSDLYSEWRGRGRWQFIGLYGLKSAYDFMQLTTALKGLLEVLVKRALLSPKNLLVEGVAKLLAWETLAWLCSWEAMILIFLVEELVIYFSDNDLQKWCRSCVFGLEPPKMLQSTQFIYPDSQRNTRCEEQRHSFANALKDGL
ncbi:T6SS effector BTH_I2691 family protein [Photorhabdus sp. CRCIA-P01]|uniref:T6SS effector BTH_I2691 family protein n=1 Tax=Photorhabdus sp. CRCIA-P01 TaxID=2019570 RepID=UPI000E59E065|nr:T6SS effector BTH_I2691 family protein [Photorhabdus sp. CRCIA-P01]